MPNEFPMNDPQQIWQNQPTEPFQMSADEIRRKAHERQTKSQTEARFGITLGLALSVVFGLLFFRVHDALPRAGWALLSLWGLYFAYQAYRWTWPARLEPDATAGTSLQYYRSELEKRRDYRRHVWLRAGFPVCFVGMVLAVVGTGNRTGAAPPRALLNAVPFCVLLIVWLVAFLRLRKRGQQSLQQEIEDLRALEREGRP